MKIGVFGGTFNPIHKGHVTASINMYDTVGLDLLLVIPDRIPPHKSGVFVHESDRLAMVKLAYCDKNIVGNRKIEVSDIELVREGKSYTVITLRELSKKYNGAELFLYVGSDMFYTLENWYMGEEILRSCSVVTTSREKSERDKISECARKYKERYGTECIIMDYEPIVLSSTDIREMIKQAKGKKITEFTNNLLTDDVAEYIMKKGLYRE